MKNLKPELLLRLGIGICFIGHGVLAFTLKAKFLTLLSSFGIFDEMAIICLKFIGLVDILVGVSVILKPNTLVLKWAVFWTAMTIIAWGIHGDSLMDLFRRVPFVAMPAGLLVMMHHRDNKQTSIETDPKEESGIADKEKAIQNLDLSMICMKLMDKREGEGWTEQQCSEVSEEYRRYLKMKLFFPNDNIVPNLAIDTMWHYHILDTEAYYNDCNAIFGEILHHYPYFGMKGDSDKGQFMSAFDRTKLIYKELFNQSMDGPYYLSSFK